MNRYSELNRGDLERRLAAAEDCCLMMGWSGTTDDTSDRGAAATELWMRWARLPGVSTSPQDYPELVGAEQSPAAARRAVRAQTLRRISGEGQQ